MAQLDDAADDADLGESDIELELDDSVLVDVDDINDDLDAVDDRVDLDLAAMELGVRLVEHGRSLDVVDDDGDVLGTVDERGGVSSRC